MYRIEFMLRSQIHQALGQVQQLQRKILEKQRFKGYSGRARAISGTVAFGASILMSTPYFPKSYSALLGGWSTVLIFSLVLNF